MVLIKMPVDALTALSALVRLCFTKKVVEHIVQPALQSNLVRSIAFGLLVVILVDSLAFLGMVLTVNCMACAYFFMNPGNVVPLLDSEKYELQDGHLVKHADSMLSY